MISLIDREIVVFDLETTDSSVTRIRGDLPEIVELGAIKIDRHFNCIDNYETLVCPKNLDDYTDFSEGLTGIKKTTLSGCLEWREQWKEFAKFANYNAIKLCAWGMDFDMGVLRKESGVSFPYNQSCIDARSMVYFYAAMQGLNLPHCMTLTAVAKYFEINRPAKHRALDDALTVVKILQAIAGKESSASNYPGVSAV